MRFKLDTGAAARQAARERSGVTFERSLIIPRAQVVDTQGQSVAAAVRRLERDPRVLYAEPNYRMEYAAVPPNDPRFGELWGIRNTGQTVNGATGVAGIDTNAFAAWDQTRGADQVIAIVDTGVALAHPDLAPNLWSNPDETVNGVDDDDNGLVDDIHGYDFGTGDADPDDAEGHGTHVAGTAGAVADNALGIAGVAPQAKVMALAVADEKGVPFSEASAAAVVYAAQEGADVINMSIGSIHYSQLQDDAVSIARSFDAVVTVSAMNDSSDNDSSPRYPCNLTQPNLLCIASIDADGALSDFSNFGATSVDVGAPGRNILSGAPAWEEFIDDDFETDLAGRWTSSGQNDRWGRLQLDAGIHVLTESVDGPYPNDTNSTITTVQPVDLSGRSECRLSFGIFHLLASGDRLAVGVRDSSGSATELDAFTGDSVVGEAPGRALSLAAVEGRSGLRPYFTFVSDSSGTDEGAFIDDFFLRCRTDTWDEASAYIFADGTSMAAPHVAGVAALVRAAVPQANADEVARAIRATVVPMASLQGKTVTGGRVDAAAASQEATPDTTAPTVTLVTPADGSSGNDTTPTYSGEAGDGAGDSNAVILKVYAGLTPSGMPVQTRPALRAGSTWAVTGSPALAPGVYTAQAEQTDAAGNTGLSSANTFTVGTRSFALAPPFDASYTIDELGAPPGVPARLGGLTLKAGTTDRLLIGGNANEDTGALYEVGVIRDASGHITGFSGAATRFADAAFNDGGVAYGPGGVLFLARYDSSGPPGLGQTKPASSITDKIVDLEPHGVAHSPGAVQFVPNGLPGAGSLKLMSWPGGEWYDAAVAPDATGTYDLVNVTEVAASKLGGGPDGVAYVNPGSPQFSAPSVLVSEFSANSVAAYEVDANGDPAVATRRGFITGLTGALGAFIDPVTGDFLFSTFETAGGTVIVVRGFEPTRATLRVVKQVVNDHGGTKGAGDFSVHVKTGGTDVAGSPQPGSTAGTTYQLPAGSYTVSENTVAGYGASFSGDCNATGQITLTPAVTKTCTVTNNDIAPTLRVVKRVVNDDGGTAAAGAWTMHIRSGGVDVPGSPFPGAATGVTRALRAGSFVVGESGGPPGYEMTSISGDCNAAGEITLALAENRTCTVTNDDISPSAQPRLRVVKQVVNDDGGTTGAGDFSIHVKANGVDVAGSPQPGSGSGTTYTLDPGSYAVSEDVVSGYQGSFTGDCSPDGTVSLAAGQTKTCTVVNNDVAPTLTVIKQVVNNDGGTAVPSAWTMHIRAGAVDVPGKSPFPGAAAPGVTRTLAVGSYVVGESGGPAGYRLASISGACDGLGNVSLALGENKTCTVVNDDVAPTLTVIKQVVNDDGGSAPASAWMMHIRFGVADVPGSPFPGAEAPGTTRALLAGSYVVGESGGLPGYAGPSFGGDCDGNGVVSLAVGESKTCTVKNNDVAPTLHVIKRVVNDNGGRAVPSAWTMHIRSGGVDVPGSPFAGDAAGVTRALRAGSYVVGESGGPTGYRMTSISGDCDAAGEVTLAPAENKTCTVTNNDVVTRVPASGSCHGRRATIRGTDGNDSIGGTKRADVIVAGAGNDVVNAGKGKDLVCAGPGHDGVRGGDKADVVYGGPGNDALSGEKGNDRILGEEGNDALNGGTGKDACAGGPGRNVLRGCEGRRR